MKHPKERALMAAVLLGAPSLLLWLGLLPVIRRGEALRQQIRSLNAEFVTLSRFSPLSKEERELTQDPAAAWRSRMPMVAGDQARLAHYNRVVSELQETLKQAGVASSRMRSSWDPIQASFTIPEDLGGLPASAAPSQDSAELQASGWVLEAEIPGATPQLFKALAATHRVHSLLEPVGLRWEAGPDHRRQNLLLRNLVLTP